jgi:hypothetical protein
MVSFTPLPRYPGNHRVDPKIGLNDLEQRKFLALTGLELQPLSRPARSQSLYRLLYPGSRLQSKEVHLNSRSCES